MKVLGIDDNLEICKLFEVVFSSAGHEFTYVTSGKDGLRMIRENRFDLVLLDIAMPEFSGLDLLEGLDKENLADKQKIVIVSASTSIDRELEHLKTTAVADVLRKPVDLDELLKTAERAIAA
jgi:DNA-binding response OmpR family regulator